MRIWSLHPSHLDRAGLVAGWREALLAQAVLAGKTKGYKRHPQLRRFQDASSPLGAIGTYLRGLYDDAVIRGYRFDESKILEEDAADKSIAVTRGQLDYEWKHLGVKLAKRSPIDAERWNLSTPTAHPIFSPVPGIVEDWERILPSPDQSS